MMAWMRWLLALALGASAVVAAAETTCPPAPPQITPDLITQAIPFAKDRGWLWAIRKDGRTSYLYGTLHVGRAQWMAPGPGLKRALQATDVLALELDPLDPEVQRALATANENVRRQLSAATAQRLKASWEAACLPPTDFTRGAPELRAFELMIAAAQREGLSPFYGSEILLSLVAKVISREVVSLETAARQIEAILARDDAEAERLVADTLDDVEQGKLRIVMARTAEVWEQGDLATLARYGEWCECMDTDSERQLMKRLLEDRNPGLADAVDRLHTQGRSVLAAVGALHLPGPAGMVSLLEKKGYAVRRVH